MPMQTGEGPQIYLQDHLVYPGQQQLTLLWRNSAGQDSRKRIVRGINRQKSFRGSPGRFQWCNLQNSTFGREIVRVFVRVMNN